LTVSEFNWWSLLPTLVGTVVGGGISLTSTLFMQSRAQRIETAKKNREAQKAAANQAFFALTKLVRTSESIENLARHFDAQLNEAREEGRENYQPYDIYKAVLGAPHHFEDVSAAETLFLTKGNGELIARIGEIQQRARNNEPLALEYSNARRKLDAFMLEHISETTTLNGSRLMIEVDSRLKTKVDVLQGQLNQMIVPLIVALGEDRKSVIQIIKEFVGVARSQFGDDFPSKGIELRGSRTNANP
jgi:hypothetical protein